MGCYIWHVKYRVLNKEIRNISFRTLFKKHQIQNVIYRTLYGEVHQVNIVYVKIIYGTLHVQNFMNVTLCMEHYLQNII